MCDIDHAGRCSLSSCFYISVKPIEQVMDIRSRILCIILVAYVVFQSISYLVYSLVVCYLLLIVNLSCSSLWSRVIKTFQILPVFVCRWSMFLVFRLWNCILSFLIETCDCHVFLFLVISQILWRSCKNLETCVWHCSC